MVSTPRLAMSGLAKAFGRTRALAGASLVVEPGEVHGLIGENGAGKSTLMQVLCGTLRPDAGSVLLDGEPFAPPGPLQARRHGVVMIHQELSLAPHLGARENVLLGVEPARLGWVDVRRGRALVTEVLAELGQAQLPLEVPVGRLSAAQQQTVEIARALIANPRLLVMDEPTSSLGPREVEALFDVIRRLSARGVSIVYISHFLEECAEICERYSVLRDGASVASGPMSADALPGIVEQMIGRRLEDAYRAGQGDAPSGAAAQDLQPTLMEVQNLEGRRAPAGISFGIRAGEIYGLAGLVGAGRTETLRAIFGLDPRRGGRVLLRGHPAGRTPSRNLRLGVAMLSENRRAEGLLPRGSIAENLTLSRLAPVARLGFISRRRLRRVAERLAVRLGIRLASVFDPIEALSGGNQQKVALGRLLHGDAFVWLLDEPTRGVDVGSKAEIYRLIREQASAGKAVLLVSSYLPELLSVCHTIGVLHRGRLIASRPAARWTEHELLQAALGDGSGP